MNTYNIDISDTNLHRPLASLNVLYNGMPKTFGCDQCENINGKDKIDWCCTSQSPSMFYVEFLNVFHIYQTWSHNKKSKIILRAIRNYLDNSFNKGCIFYNNGCQVYKHRPYACRIYGVIPKKTWDKRWELLKQRQGSKFCAKKQCSLVSSEKEITSEMEEKWFSHTIKCEERIGISKTAINLHDRAGGSYRTFHDHLLLEVLGEDALVTLTNVRITNPSLEEIDSTVKKMEVLIDQAL